VRTEPYIHIYIYVYMYIFIVKGEGKATPLQAYYRLIGFQGFEAPRFRDSRHMKLVRLSALRIALGSIQVHLLRQHYFWGIYIYIARWGEYS
jgi:hypothetical protein